MKRIGVLVLGMMLLVGCASSRPWTKGELIAAGVGTAAAAWDTVETMDALSRSKNTYEMNPAMGRRPSDGRVIGTMAFSQALTIAIAHFFPTMDLPLFGECEIRIPLLYGKAGMNAAFALHNRSVGR